MQTLWQDLRYGARMLMKKPGFTLIAVFTLALGIGATSTIFSFVNGILLRPLPYQDAARLVLVNEVSSKRSGSLGVSYPNFLDWRAQNHSFTGIAAWDDDGFILTGSGEPEVLSAGEISYDTFEVLGVAPLLGRNFRAEEDQPGRNDVVILSHGLWTRRFGAKSDIIGRTISLDNHSRTVIGVMPPGFRFPADADLWVTISDAAQQRQRWVRTDYGLGAVARLKPGVTLAQAQADMNAVARHIEELNPVTNEGRGIKLDQMRAGLTSDYQTSLPLLLGVVGMVLLIACANLVNLLLARASTRRRELAVRAALGAGRARLFRQLLIESSLLGALGGACGLALAWWGLDLVLAAIPVEFPFWMKFNLDARVIAFTVGVTLLTSLIFGTVPALQASQIELTEALKEGGRSGASGSRHRLRSALVVAEVALSLVLLVGAGLMVRSFLRLQQVNPGFNPEHVLTAGVSLSDTPRYDTPEKRRAFFQQLRERIGVLPGVQDVGGVSHLPLTGAYRGDLLTVEGYPVLPVGQAPGIYNSAVTPHYFSAMGIPLLAGRDFTEADTRDAPLVTIIDERLAREYWPQESALGKRIRFGPPEDNSPWHTIVGVVGEVKQERLDWTRRKNVYLPQGEIARYGLTLAVRATTDAASLTAALRRELKSLDPNLPLTQVLTMEEIVARSVWQPHLYALLFGVFATVALLLAAVGLYGVMSYAVTQRTPEIGIRLALGAQRHDVLRLVLRSGMRLVALGLGIGATVAFALTRLMQTLLFNVRATDPLTFGLIALLLTVVTLLACWIPARRATKVDPMIALRSE